MGSGASTPQEGEDKGDGVAKFLGRDLSEQQLVMVDGFRVPVSLVRCRDELYQHGLGQKDLFKQECSAPEVNEFLDFIERGEKFEGQRNAYAVSEAFKKLLKSVPRRLLHDVQHMELEPGTTPQAQWAIFVRVNETARAVLFWVVKFLGEVAQYEDDNGMDPQRLAEAICDCFISELSSKLDMAAAVKHWTPHLAVWIADARDERFSPAGGASQNPSEHKTAAPESKSAEGVGAPGVQGTSVAGPAKNASESKPSSTAVPAETKEAVSDGGKTPTPAQSSNTVVEEKRVEKVEQPVSTAGAETKQADAQPVNVTDSSQTAEAGQATAEAVKRKDDADDEEEEEEDSEDSEESEEAPEPEDDRTTAAGGSSEAATSHSSADGIKEAPANNASNDVASGAQSAAAAPEAKQSHAESAKPDGGEANAGKEPAASGQGLSDDASATSPGPQSRSKNTPTEEDAEASAANSTVDAQVTEKKGKKSKKEKKDRKDKKSRRTSKSGASALLADGAAENGSGSDGTGSAAAPVADDTNKANDHDSYGDASFASAEGGAAAPADKPGDPIKNPTSDADTDADAAGAQTKAGKKGKKPKKDKKLRRDSSTARSKTAEGARPKSSSGSGSKEKKKDKKKDKKKSSSKRKKATKVDSDDEPF